LKKARQKKLERERIDRWSLLSYTTMSEPPLKKRKLDEGVEVSKTADDQENPGSENDEDADPSQNNSEENSSNNEAFSFASNSIDDEEFLKILKSKELFKEWVDKQKEKGLDADDIFFKLGFPEDMVMTMSVKVIAN
jgi:hypothetical protein